MPPPGGGAYQQCSGQSPQPEMAALQLLICRLLTHNFPGSDFQHRQIGTAKVAAVCAQHHAITQHIDKPRNSARITVYATHNGGRENFLARVHARHLQPMPDIGPGLFLAQGLEVIACCYALVQLAQLRPAQHLCQLGLANQNDLQQLFAVGFQVGEQANLLQHVKVQMLGLVDQQYGFAAAIVVFQQIPMQAVGQCFEGVSVLVIIDSQLIADSGKQLHRIECGVENNGDIGVLRQLLKQAAVNRGLASAHLSRQQNKAAASADAIEQVRQSIPVTGTHKEIARIDRYRKGRFCKPEILVVHAAGSQSPVRRKVLCIMPKGRTQSYVLRRRQASTASTQSLIFAKCRSPPSRVRPHIVPWAPC